MSAHAEITNGIRSALASEEAAGRHEDRYDAQMKSAGASMYAAFSVALRASDEFQGRKIDDKAILRVYGSNKPRPWWDHHLKEAKAVTSKGAADRDRAKRLIQWHIDPAAALERRAKGQIQQLASQKRLNRQRNSDSRGMNSRPSEPTAREARIVVEAAANAAHAGRELPGPDEPVVTLEDLLGESSRINSAVRKILAANRGSAMTILRQCARQLELHVP